MSKKLLFVVFMLFVTPQSFASPGNLFAVTPINNSIVIKTNIPNHTYAQAGLQVVSIGHNFSTYDCDSVVDDTCIFSVSDTSSKTLSFSGPSGPLDLKLCLNGAAHITCQTYQIPYVTSIVSVGAMTPSGGTQQAVSYTSNNNGLSWSGPNILSSAAGSVGDQLNAVSCDASTNFCTAAGFYLLANNDEAPVVYTSTNGGLTWSSPLLPATSPNRTEILGLDCSSNGQLCQAVGYNLQSRNIPVIYSATNSNWNGLTWEVPPEPSGSASLFSRVNSVSCTPSGENCVAVGWHADNITGWNMPYSLYTTNAGGTWNLGQQPAIPTGYGTGVTFGVSCASQGAKCLAVGFLTQATDNSAPRLPVSYSSNDGGVSWGNAVLPDLPTSLGATAGQLVAVACSQDGMTCTTVGQYTASSGTYHLTYRTMNGGATWSAASIPQALSNSNANTLSSVSCSVTGGLCVTVGYSRDSVSNQNVPVSFTANDGINWGPVVTLPLPSGATGFLQSTSYLNN